MTGIHSTPHHPAPGHQPGGYERSDLTPRPIVLAMLIGSIFIALVFVAMWGVTQMFETRHARLSPRANPLAETAARKEPPAPRLQPDPVKDMAALRAWEDAQLSHYGWVDKPAGIVHIPIERALDLMAERGLPARRVEQPK
jgi:hypothetical protein